MSEDATPDAAHAAPLPTPKGLAAPATTDAADHVSVDASAAPLLTPGFIRQLETLSLGTTKMFRGQMKGERRSPRRGQSVEFADFRSYVVGDELRFVDWNAFARLEKLFLKLYLEEEDLHLTILLDASASMAYGSPDKLLFAKRLAAALGYMGLVRQDRVTLLTTRWRLTEGLSGLRGRRAVHRLLGFLDAVKGLGETDLTTACREFALRHKTKGIVVLISDFLDRQGHEEALRYLLMSRSDVVVLHVLAPDEIDPEIPEDLQLVDLETEARVDIAKVDAVLQGYKRTLAVFTEGLRTNCQRRGIMYVQARSDDPLETLVLKTLRHYRVVR